MVRRIRSPLSIFGGKSMLAPKILSLFPEHERYCEPFLGGGAIFFSKKPCPYEVINDVDEAIILFFRILCNRSEELISLCQLTEYNECLFDECRATWHDEPDELLRAWKWFVVSRQSFSGYFGYQSHVVTTSRSGHAISVSTWISVVRQLPKFVGRLRNAKILCGDWWEAVQLADAPDCLHYMDPPYVPQTRKGRSKGNPGKKYRYELTIEDHEQLVDRLLHEVQGHVVLSGYAHPVYKPLEDAGWKRIDWKTVCHAVGKGRDSGLIGVKGATKKLHSRIESVWLDPRTAADVMIKLPLD